MTFECCPSEQIKKYMIKTMFADTDGTIKQPLTQRANQDSVDTAFDMAAREWAAGITRLAVNLYFHDTRERIRRSSNLAQQTALIASKPPTIAPGDGRASPRSLPSWCPGSTCPIP